MYEMGAHLQSAIDCMPNKTPFKNVYVYVTNACNMHCKHCYLGDRLGEREVMPLGSVENHLAFWRKLGGEKLCFLGGEPTMYPFLQEAITIAQDLGYPTILIDSNLTNRALDILSDIDLHALSYIQTSLDGTSRECHERIRARGTYDQTLNSIRELVAQSVDVRIIMTVNKLNKHEAIDMIDLAESLGCSLIKFHIMSEIGNALDGGLGLGPEEWIELCGMMRQHACSMPNRKIRVAYQPAYGDRNEPDPLIAEGYRGCVGKSYERISIFPDGRCYICSFLLDGESYAMLDDDGRIDINSRALDGHFANEQCDICPQQCGYDGCVAENLKLGESPCSRFERFYPVCRLWKIEV